MFAQAERTNPVAACVLFTKFNYVCEVHQIAKIKVLFNLFCKHKQNAFDISCGRQIQLRRPSVARGLFITAVGVTRLREMDRFYTTVRHAD